MQISNPKLIFVSKSQPFFCQFTPEQYLQYTQVSYILSQASKTYLRKPQSTPYSILPQFFQQYIRGQHVLLKAYNNFQKSSFSKLCFVCNFSKIFDIQQSNFGQRTGFDYFQLIRLVCSDFPKQYIVNSLKLSSGDFSTAEQLIMNKIIRGQQFTKGLFMSCMYSQFIKQIQSMGDLQISELIQYFKQSYKKKKMQFELPSYKIVMDTLIKSINSTNNISGSGNSCIIFVNDDNIGNHISLTQCINTNVYLNYLYQNELNQREISQRLQFFDISKLLQNKQNSTVITKTKKKKK